MAPEKEMEPIQLHMARNMFDNITSAEMMIDILELAVKTQTQMLHFKVAEIEIPKEIHAHLEFYLHFLDPREKQIEGPLALYDIPLIPY